MNNIYETYKPGGFGTVSSYLFVEKPEEYLGFLKDAFYAEELNRSIHPENGELSNAILRIGDTCLMVSKARGQFCNMRTALYLFVDDVDMMHDRAVMFGAEVEFEPADMPYKDRQSGIVDPGGNYWWISKRLVNKGYHE